MLNISKTREFAITQHGSQMYGDKPYSFHLDAVYQLVKEFELGLEYEYGAYLHDLIEDTAITKEYLKEHYNEEIANMVFSVSGFGENRKEKQANIVSKLNIEDNYKAINLKMLDRIANMNNSKVHNERLYNMYCKEFPLYEEVFSKGDNRLFERLKSLLPQAPKLKL